MSYTLAELKEVFGSVKVNIDKSGNQYLVGLCDCETQEYKHKTFNSLEEALKIFQKLSEAIIKGIGSYEYKCNLLLEG